MLDLSPMQVREFFEKLLQECEKKHVYSVIETIEKEMDTTYAQVKSWAEQDEELREVLNFCHELCEANADIDAIMGNLSPEECIKYMNENSREFKENNKKYGYYQIEEIVMKAPEKITYEENVQAARIQKFKERQAQEAMGCTYKAVQADKSNINILPEFANPNLTPEERHELQGANLCAATGTANTDYARLLFEQTVASCFKNDTRDAAFMANAMQSALISMNPQDEYEGMLCSRLLALHNQSMEFMSRSASPNQTSEGVDININRSTKLMRLWNETLDALTKYRRKEQKITVQHVHVNDGGQAVVAGQFSSGVNSGGVGG